MGRGTASNYWPWASVSSFPCCSPYWCQKWDWPAHAEKGLGLTVEPMDHVAVQPMLTHPALWEQCPPVGGHGRRTGSCPPPPGGKDGGEASVGLWGANCFWRMVGEDSLIFIHSYPSTPNLQQLHLLKVDKLCLANVASFNKSCHLCSPLLETKQNGRLNGNMKPWTL